MPAVRTIAIEMAVARCFLRALLTPGLHLVRSPEGSRNGVAVHARSVATSYIAGPATGRTESVAATLFAAVVVRSLNPEMD